MLQQLLLEEEQFQVKLRNGDYTLIAPTDADNFDEFIKLVNDLAPTTFYSTIHDSLRHKESVSKALMVFTNVPLQIYVIVPSGNDSSLFHTTIGEYNQDEN